MKRKPIIYLITILTAAIFITNMPASGYAADSESYTVNGVTLPLAGYEPGTEWDNCWTFANIVYKAIWGTSSGADMLENLSGSDLEITESNTKRYIRAAELGANIRLEDGKGVNEHSLILVQKDNEGFTVYHGNYNGAIYFTYYTYEGFASHYADYKYFAYINYPNADPYEIIGSGTCGDDITWELDNYGMLSINGSGEMSDCSDQKQWHSQYADITDIVIEDGVTSIGAYAFYGLSEAQSVYIPDSVESFGDLAFCDCSSLTDIYIDDNSSQFEFVGGVLCSKDKSTILLSPRDIEGEYTAAEETKYVSTTAFDCCGGLTDIIFSSELTSIGAAAFGDCTGLTQILLPFENGSTIIEMSAFWGCTGLKRVSIAIPFHYASSITNGDYFELAQKAFENCENLTRIDLPKQLYYVYTNAFNNCDKLKDIYFTGAEYDNTDKDVNDFIRAGCPEDVKLHYNYAPYTPVNGSNYKISLEKYQSSYIDLDIEYGDSVSGSQTLYIACYDETGNMIKLYIENVSQSNWVFASAYKAVEGTAEVKAFIWNNADYMMPASNTTVLEW